MKTASPRLFEPDYLMRIDFSTSSFVLEKDALYDRAPATLRLNATARVYDMAGSLLRETEIKLAKQERLRLERLGKNCDYVIAPFIRETVIELASKVFLDARLAFAEQQPQSPAAQTPLAPPPPSSLRFKAMLLDENSNLILEGGEHVRVRVDVVNTGPNLIQNASAIVTGTPALIEQFPTTTLSIPPLQPGETKSLEFVATLPPSVQAQQAEIHVAVAESEGARASSQTLPLTIQPTGIGADDVDQIPAPTPDFLRPNTYLISIGVGSYLDPRILPRKYASADAKMVANYFQSLGGVPPVNIRLLLDWKARRTDIDETLLHWLPSRLTHDAVVIVYFSGQAMISPTGDVLLVPYEGSPKATTWLYPLKDLVSALSRLETKQTIFLFDGMVSGLSGNSDMKDVVPRWDTGGRTMIRLIGGDGFTIGLEDNQHRHSLFTYYLLRGVRGEADTNRDGAVTLREIVSYVGQKVPWAAKSQFQSEQRPLIIPPLSPDHKAAALILSKLTSLIGSETP